VTTFLPLVTEIRRWSDRWKSIESALFGGYVFVKMSSDKNEERIRVLRTESVFDFVGVSGRGTPIPEAQIESVQAIVRERVEWQFHPFLKIGQRVRIRNGALKGVEGILVDRGKGNVLVVSLSLLQRSLAIHIDGYSVEAF
jgi:transcription antitermination factor NusG